MIGLPLFPLLYRLFGRFFINYPKIVYKRTLLRRLRAAVHNLAPCSLRANIDSTISQSSYQQIHCLLFLFATLGFITFNIYFSHSLSETLVVARNLGVLGNIIL